MTTTIRRLVSTMRRQAARPVGPTPLLTPTIGVVQSVQSGSVNSVTVAIGAGSSVLSGVRYASGLTPSAGKQVLILAIGGVPWVLDANA